MSCTAREKSSMHVRVRVHSSNMTRTGPAAKCACGDGRRYQVLPAPSQLVACAKSSPVITTLRDRWTTSAERSMSPVSSASYACEVGAEISIVLSGPNALIVRASAVPLLCAVVGASAMRSPTSQPIATGS